MRSFVPAPLRALLVFATLFLAASASAKVKTGTYLGDGSVSGNITGVGFAPVVVIVKGNDTDPTDDLTSAVLRSATMPAGMSKPLKGDQGLFASGIVSLNADGFSVGSNRRVNAVGIQFHYVAFDASPNLALGTYTGNGGSLSVPGVPSIRLPDPSGGRGRVARCSTPPPLERASPSTPKAPSTTW
jgi:hypothetical protein